MIEIRRNSDGSIDEIVAQGCDLQIEQMTDDGWSMEITFPSGDLWLFHIGAKNGRSHVNVELTERPQQLTTDQ